MAKFETKDKIGDKLYHKGLKKQQMKEQYIKQMRDIKEEKEVEGLTFKPNLPR